MDAIQNNVQPQMAPILYGPKQEPLQAENISVNNKSYKSMDKEEAEQIVSRLNKALDPFKTALHFGVDNRSNTFYVSVIETQTNQLIRRYPLEQMPPLMNATPHQSGFLFDQKG